MTSIAHAISAALIHFLWQGLVVAFLLWITLATLRNGPARLRYLVSCAALAIMTALPAITAWVAYRAPRAASTWSGPLAGVPDSARPAILPVAASLPGWIAALEAWALPVWFAGVLVFAVRLIWSSRHVARLRREGDPPEASLVETVSHLARRMNIGRPVDVLISSLADSPSVAGWLRPVVLLPAASLLNLSVKQLEAVLAHELAHIRRHDYLVNVLQTLAETLFFYQPAVWWVSSRIRDERELCCDDMAVEICGDAVGYARALTKLERLRVIAPELALSSAGGPLLYRIQRLTGTVEEQRPSKLPAVLAVCFALVCFMTNLHWAKAEPQAAREAVVSREAVWVDTVKYGEFQMLIRALGTLTKPSTAELNVVTSQANQVQIGQSTSILLRPGLTMVGKVARVDSHAANGTVAVAVELQSPLPEFVAQPVDGTILIKTMNDVVYVGRPIFAPPADSEVTLFKVESDGSHAQRVKVRFGAYSVNSMQILEGLQPGDRVILSDMAKYDGYDRIRLE
jgi:beta-lactamase regulating signal transducer with metallopeptidase domain